MDQMTSGDRQVSETPDPLAEVRKQIADLPGMTAPDVSGDFHSWKAWDQVDAILAAARPSPAEPREGQEIGRSIAEAVRRVSNREAFRFVNIDWTALGAALVKEWPFAATVRSTTPPEPEEAAK